MRTGILLNPRSGAGEGREALKALVEESVARVEEVPGPGLGAETALRMIEDGVERLVAAGGDGTVHEAANAILRSGRAVTLGVVPFGTGNDFARSLGIPLDPESAVRALLSAPVRRVDAFRADSREGDVFGINAAQGGLPVAVLGSEGPDRKAGSGLLAYLAGAADGLREVRTYRATVTWDGGSPEEHRIASVTVANGRSAGGGVPIAPGSSLEDGLLDVVMVLGGTLAELAPVAARIVLGTHLEDDGVLHRRVERLTVRSDPPMPVGVDGEEIAPGPIEFTVLPAALAVLVGPEYRERPP